MTTMRSVAGWVVSIAVLLGSAVLANAQTQDTEALSKVVDAAVIDLSRANVSQRLLVTLEDSDLLARKSERQRSHGLSADGQREVDESAAAYTAVKRSVFPEGYLGKSKVVKDFSCHLPTVLVEVPDLESLVLLVNHPRVKFVNADSRVYTTGT